MAPADGCATIFCAHTWTFHPKHLLLYCSMLLLDIVLERNKRNKAPLLLSLFQVFRFVVRPHRNRKTTRCSDLCRLLLSSKLYQSPLCLYFTLSYYFLLLLKTSAGGVRVSGLRKISTTKPNLWFRGTGRRHRTKRKPFPIFLVRLKTPRWTNLGQ